MSGDVAELGSEARHYKVTVGVQSQDALCSRCVFQSSLWFPVMGRTVCGGHFILTPGVEPEPEPQYVLCHSTRSPVSPVSSSVKSQHPLEVVAHVFLGRPRARTLFL